MLASLALAIIIGSYMGTLELIIVSKLTLVLVFFFFSYKFLNKIAGLAWYLPIALLFCFLWGFGHHTHKTPRKSKTTQAKFQYLNISRSLQCDSPQKECRFTNDHNDLRRKLVCLSLIHISEPTRPY